MTDSYRIAKLLPQVVGELRNGLPSVYHIRPFNTLGPDGEVVKGFTVKQAGDYPTFRFTVTVEDSK